MIFSNNPKRHLPGDGWKGVRHDDKSGDDVFLHEEDALAMVSLSAVCESHRKDSFCLRCLPRLEAAAAAARSALDPDAPALIEELPSESPEFPEYLALYNPIQKNAFAMRLDQPRKLSATKMILTSKRPDYVFERPVSIIGYSTESRVCDAIFLKAFHVRLEDGVPEAYAKRLWEAKFSLSIDGEPMVSGRPFRELLGRKEILLPRPVDGQTCLFAATAVKGPPDGPAEVYANDWLGYMLPNGTRIDAKLDGVPGGGGLIRIKIGWSFGMYTTKSRQGSASHD